MYIYIGLVLPLSILLNKDLCRAWSVSGSFVKQAVKLAHEQEPISVFSTGIAYFPPHSKF